MTTQSIQKKTIKIKKVTIKNHLSQVSERFLVVVDTDESQVASIEHSYGAAYKVACAIQKALYFTGCGIVEVMPEGSAALDARAWEQDSNQQVNWI